MVLKQEPIDFEIIIVDDNSPDETWRLAQEIAGEDSHLQVIRRGGARGLRPPLWRGGKRPKGDIWGVMDADLQHPPEILPDLLGPILKVELISRFASRHTSGGGVGEWNLPRRFVSRGRRPSLSCFCLISSGSLRIPCRAFF